MISDKKSVHYKSETVTLAINNNYDPYLSSFSIACESVTDQKSVCGGDKAFQSNLISVSFGT